MEIYKTLLQDFENCPASTMFIIADTIKEVSELIGKVNSKKVDKEFYWD